MLIYATAADLTAARADGAAPWMVPTDVPANVGVLLRHASNRVRVATRIDRYFTYPLPAGAAAPASAPCGTVAGMPSDPVVAQAFNDATCQQVVFWTKNQIDPDKGAVGMPRPVTAQAVPGGGSIQYDTTSYAEWLWQAVNELCPDSVDILRNAGLIALRPDVM